MIILSAIALIASSCGQAMEKQVKTVNNENISETFDGTTKLQNVEKVSFDYKTLPTEWAQLSYRPEDEKYVVCGGNENSLTIEGNKLVYWGSGYDILKSYQIGDTIVINVKFSNLLGEYEEDFKFFWFDKDKGIGKWTANDKILGDSGLFVIKEKLSKFLIVKCWGDEEDE